VGDHRAFELNFRRAGGLILTFGTLDLVQEADKRLMPAVLHRLADNLARKRVESGDDRNAWGRVVVPWRL
jgi:hypothetical protein